MTTERLFGIIYHLLNKKKTTTTELANLFEVSTRTIHRDINRLSSVGVPIVSEPGRNGGISLLNNFILNKVLLSEEEQTNLLTALKGIRKISPEVNDEVFSKLHSLFQVSFDDWLEIDFSTWHQVTKLDNKFELLKSSILKKQQLEFTYSGLHEFAKQRHCYPYKLVFKSQAWYLHAFCLTKNEFRWFKVNRISNLILTDKMFVPTRLPDILKPVLQIATCPFVLEISNKLAYRVYDEFEHKDITIKDSETLCIKTHLPDEDWLINYLLSFGKHLKVIAPTSMTNRIKAELRMMYLNYSDK